jgi:hypothetical protein
VNGELTLWDHITLLGAMVVVIGYIILRVRIALNPNQGGCGGCGCSEGGGECGGTPSVSTVSPPSSKREG